MGMEIYEEEREIERLKFENEKEDQKLSLAQKKAVRKEMKRRYGVDWKAMLGKFTQGDWFRVSSELRNSVIPKMNRR